MIVAQEKLGDGIILAIDAAVGAVAAFTEQSQREFTALFSDALREESGASGQRPVLSLLRRIVEWFREFAKKVIAFFKRVVGYIASKLRPGLRSAENAQADPAYYTAKTPAVPAEGIDPAEFKRAGTGLHAVRTAESQVKGMTCGQLLAQEDYSHPSDVGELVVPSCSGMGMAPEAVRDMEDAFVDLYEGLVLAQMEAMRHSTVLNASPVKKIFNARIHEIFGRTTKAGGFPPHMFENGTKDLVYWYIGPEQAVHNNHKSYMMAATRLSVIEREAAELTKDYEPGEKVAGLLERLSKILATEGYSYTASAKTDLVEALRESGNGVVKFHNALINGALASFRGTAIFVHHCLSSVAYKPDFIDGKFSSPKTTADVPLIPYRETVEYVTEGFGSLIKNIATGDIEGEIDELEKEFRDVHTPEQQRFVLTKIVRLLERLVVIRHNPGTLAAFVHDRVAWFERVLGGSAGSAGKEMNVRVGEQIARLARLRDKLLAMAWKDDKTTERIEEFKDKIENIIDSAKRTEVGSFD